MGGVAVRRPHRPLGEAQRRRHAPRSIPRDVDWDEFADLFARYGGEWADDGSQAARATRRRTSRCSTSSRRAASNEPRTSTTCSCPVLLRLRGRRPDDGHRVQHQGQPVRRPLQRHVRLRHLALGRARHGRGARRGVRDGRARAASPTPTSATSCSRNPVRFYTARQPAASSTAPRVEARGRRRAGHRELTAEPTCSISCSAAAASSTGPARPPSTADVGVRDGRDRRHRTVAATLGAAHDGRRRRPGRAPRVHRHPHPLRRAGAVGRRLTPVAAARRHDGHRRQLRLLDRAARTRARRLRDADDGPGRGHAARRARGRPGLGLAVVRRVARPPRRPAPGRQRRLPRRPLDGAPARDGRAPP